VIWSFRHFRLRLKDHKNRVQKLPPEDIPEFRREISSISYKSLKEIRESARDVSQRKQVMMQVLTEIELRDPLRSSTRPGRQSKQGTRIVPLAFEDLVAS
jgi:hypothetical protein